MEMRERRIGRERVRRGREGFWGRRKRAKRMRERGKWGDWERVKEGEGKVERERDPVTAGYYI